MWPALAGISLCVAWCEDSILDLLSGTHCLFDLHRAPDDDDGQTGL